eukprot:CAMPEP_0201482506 /NCGR_PEP_ID=MMETSP0151_2-20130828/6786_1 /ASSEMBLY_ACC=CAM_ASM_000257 /TAXON_ID=200890 /ORGANISM="Paramoeba atlantica, Strain 621/1 / CCAP 1560/9" /LENGTH=286 /DNA_ID=CAMNT_0047865249 /DNA_START=143 /DNA_END=1003 /DNA_ORIENTATION=+
MPVHDLHDPVGFQLLHLSSDDDQEMMEGVACLLGLRHKPTLHSRTSPSFDKTKQRGSQTSKALRCGGDSENQSSSLRAANGLTVDLGVQDFNKKRKRATREEVAVLRRAFIVNPLPPLEVRMSIAQQLNWTPRKVKIWFQNERAKVRKRTREGDLLERTRTPDSQDESDDMTKERTTTPSPPMVGGGGVPPLPMNRSVTPSGVLQTTPNSMLNSSSSSSFHGGNSSFPAPRLSSSVPENSVREDSSSPLSHSQIHCAASAFSTSHSPRSLNPLSLLEQQRLVIPQS